MSISRNLIPVAIAGMIVGMFASCQQELTNEVQDDQSLLEKIIEQKDVVLSAYYDDDQGVTKTSYESATGHILWSPGNQISLFYGSGSDGGSCFTATNDDPVQRTQFSGTIGVITGITEGTDDYYFWGVYPYNTQNSCDGTTVTTIVPHEQTGIAETFNDNEFVAIGKSAGLVMGFYNLCGAFYVKVTRSDITKITLKGKGDESLAGQVKISMSTGVPVVADVLARENEVTLTRPNGAAFIPGVGYFISCLPNRFSTGFSFEMETSEGLIGIKEYDIDFTLGRNRFQPFNATIDSGVSFGYAIPEAVDLGLSVKWASFNVGATSPTESGGYFAWGEILEKENYSWGTYKWANGWKNTLTKYNTKYGNGGSPDQKTILEANDDVAHVTYHGKWRMPTTTEWSELKSQCSWAYDSSKNGYNVTGPSGETIIIPLAGSANNTDVSYVGEYGSYWTANLASDSPNNAFSVSISPNSQSVGAYGERMYGCSVRAVFDENCTYDLLQSISLDITNLQLTLGTECTLSVLFTPEDATNRNVSWISSNPEVASVLKGTVTSLSIGTTTITATSADGNHMATCQVEVIPQETNDYVDLGLSVKWGIRNIGATKSTDYGDYYAWGETVLKDTYTWENYLWCNGASDALTKYNSNSSQGFVDNKQVLEEADDVATVLYGSGWRMPTNTEFSELCTHCSYRYINRDGVWGILFSRNDEAIFLPFSGFKAESDLRALGERGLYWCKNSPDYDSTSAFFYQLFTYTYNPQTASRTQGFSIRPVYFDPE